ncbi:MAG: helix-turn-helix transcriptional regulator [Candidatus Omnitrophota bacterium]|nr:helix-turn-helix transcriptional regulator [Candidatus Omnitrophota bacterium]
MPQDLIDQLNTYRLEHRLSQPQLAKKLGVTFQTVNRWLNRHMKPGQIHEYHIKKMLSANRSERKYPPPNAQALSRQA